MKDLVRKSNSESQDRRKKQQNLRLIISILLFGMAMVGILGMIHPFNTQPFLTLNDIMIYMLGKWHILLPFIFIIVSIRMLLGIKMVRLNTSFVSFNIMLLCAPALYHHFVIDPGKELIPGSLVHGGGLWGGGIALLLHRTIGNIATPLVLGIGCLTAIGILIPWGQMLSSKKRDEEYEAFLRETEEISARAPHRKNKAQENANAYQKRPFVKTPVAPVTHVTMGQCYQNVYANDEFSSFMEGIKSMNRFTKVLNWGAKPQTYASETMQKQLADDPVQIPTWEEEPKRRVILRPVIDYGEGRNMPDRDIVATAKTATSSDMLATAVANVGAEKRGLQKQDLAVDSEPGADMRAPTSVSVKSYSSIIQNPYHKDVQAGFSTKRPLKVAVAAQVKEASSATSCSRYTFPPLDLLAPPKHKDTAAGDVEIMQQCNVLEQTLADFRVRAKVVDATRGPAVTQFELQPAPGVKVNSIVNLADDIALRLAAPGVRMEAPIPGKSAIGIEVPNLKTDPVVFREVVDTDAVRIRPGKLCIGLGKDISGHIITADIAKMPHLLIAGSTGSGKSVCINTIICGILYKALPEEVKLILVDPKVVELSVYDGIPHLLTPVVTDSKKAASALHWAVAEMEKRYKLFADNHVRNIDGYNKNADEKMPYIVIIIDEMADLMATVKADIETAIMRLAAKARAAGIHMILATQRPSVDVITGVLKNNIPSRIAFAVTSIIDSRTILDSAGAEKLLGKGDMLFAPSGSSKPTRVQGAFVSDEEVGKIVDFIIGQSIPTEYSDEVTSVELECDKKAAAPSAEDAAATPPDPTDDPLFQKALMLVLDTGQASASMMQRRFSIGYNRAARLVDTMAELGVVGKSMGSKPREVIMSRQEAEKRFLQKK